MIKWALGNQVFKSTGLYNKVGKLLFYFEESVKKTLTFSITPSNTTIKYTINGGSTQTLSGTTLSVNVGDVVAYTFEKEGYVTYNSSKTVTENETITYTMQEEIVLVYDSTGTSHNCKEVVDDGSYTFNGSEDYNADVNKALSFNALTSVDTNYFFVSTTTLIGAFFKSKVPSVSFPNLTTIRDFGMHSMFCNTQTGGGNSSLTSISIPSLVTIGGFGLAYAFRNAINLESISFPKVELIEEAGLYLTFAGCTKLTGSISFPSLTNIEDAGLQRCFEDCTGITEVHFKSSLSDNPQCTAENMGCTNATVFFDLP